MARRVDSQELALPADSLVLVTGASSYIGSHVVNEALRAGYRVRGTTRSEEKAERLRILFGNNTTFSTAIVADFRNEGSFDEAVKGVDSIIHVASDTTFDTDLKIITSTRDGVLSILRSAAKEPSVKRFVLTSSASAALLPRLNQVFTVTEDDWNEQALHLIPASPPYSQERAFLVYAASKVEGEKALWQFMRDPTPSFIANTILPDFTMGRILPSGPTGSTGSVVKAICDGTVPPISPRHMIDVVDNARLHVIAAVLDSNVEYQHIADVIKRRRPDITSVATPTDEGRDLSDVPNKLGAELLRKWYGQDGYKPIEQTVLENLETWMDVSESWIWRYRKRALFGPHLQGMTKGKNRPWIERLSCPRASEIEDCRPTCCK